MTGTSLGLGIRSGSYGSLQQQLKENGGFVIQPTTTATTRKASKMLKEKESFILWICKLAGNKRIGMLLICIVSAAVFFWVLYIGKGLISYPSQSVACTCKSINFHKKFEIDDGTSIVRMDWSYMGSLSFPKFLFVYFHHWHSFGY